mgnify:CR=1 FL=1
MRSVATFAIAGAIAVVVQTTLLHHLRFLPAAPDLILILTVYLGLHYHSAGGALGAFLLGYLLDSFAGPAPGLYCLAMTVVFGVIYQLSKQLWMENPVSNMAAVALGSSLKILTVVAYFALVSRATVSWVVLLRTLVLEAVFALVCAPFVFSALDGQLRELRKARSREDQ